MLVLLLTAVLATLVVAPEAEGNARPPVWRDMHCNRRAAEGFYCELAGRCIDTSRVCDGVKDCWDRGDEAHCTSCVSGALACDGNGTHATADVVCVAAVYVCDGHPDCHDGKDEEGCPPHGDGGLQLFTCASGRTRKTEVVCDGIQDCDRPLDDEGDCTECQRDAVFCAGSGLCIPAALRCDGINDCKDGTDEASCDDLGRWLSPAQASLRAEAEASLTAAERADHSSPALYIMGGVLLGVLLVLPAAVFVFFRTFGGRRPWRRRFDTQLDNFGETPFARECDNATYGVEPEHEYEVPNVPNVEMDVPFPRPQRN